MRVCGMQKINPSLFSIHFICFNLVHLLEISLCYFSNTFNLEDAGCLEDQSPAAKGKRHPQTLLIVSFFILLMYSLVVLFSFLMFSFSFYWHSFSFSVIVLPLQFMYPANSLGNIEITLWLFCVFQVNDYN